jgi:hypothetical protein
MANSLMDNRIELPVSQSLVHKNFLGIFWEFSKKKKKKKKLLLQIWTDHICFQSIAILGIKKSKKILKKKKKKKKS